MRIIVFCLSVFVFLSLINRTVSAEVTYSLYDMDNRVDLDLDHYTEFYGYTECEKLKKYQDVLIGLFTCHVNNDLQEYLENKGTHG